MVKEQREREWVGERAVRLRERERERKEKKGYSIERENLSAAGVYSSRFGCYQFSGMLQRIKKTMWALYMYISIYTHTHSNSPHPFPVVPE